jgi:ferredoxin-NADP reductase/uncharacterized protein YcbX
VFRVSDIRLTAIHRFPVKGFPSQSLQQAAVEAGGGIPLDRRWAVSNGEREVAAGDWSPCQSFVRMTKNDALPLFTIAIDEAHRVLAIRSPQQEALTVRYDDETSAHEASTTLTRWFPSKFGAVSKLHSRDGGLGWWDHRDASVSIVNEATVASLSRAANVTLDPLRFRGNLYLDGLPAWSEFDWIGKRLRVGDVELEVLRPIDRCSATSVNPSTANRDFNVPTLLARAFGHVYCGLYARVVRGGTLHVNDRVDVCADPPSPVIATADTAPAPTHWPRIAQVVERVQESADVVSFWLRDPLAAGIPPPQPGQHVRIHAPQTGEPQSWRAYTISAVDGDRIRISVKRESRPGAFSAWLHTCIASGDRLLLSGPHGDFTLDACASQPVVFLSAGIGITPILAMVRALALRSDRRKVHVLHAARDGDALALWRELRTTAEQIGASSVQLYLSQMNTGNAGVFEAFSGRIDAEALQHLPLRNARIYVCGPSAFIDSMRTISLTYGAHADEFRYERFASPRPESLTKETPPSNGPFKLNFARSKQSTTWSSSDGTLLDVSERCGVPISANCRSAACETCKVKLLSGRVFHLLDPPFSLADDDALACCAVPIDDVSVDA